MVNTVNLTGRRNPGTNLWHVCEEVSRMSWMRKEEEVLSIHSNVGGTVPWAGVYGSHRGEGKPSASLPLPLLPAWVCSNLTLLRGCLLCHGALSQSLPRELPVSKLTFS